MLTNDNAAVNIIPAPPMRLDQAVADDDDGACAPILTPYVLRHLAQHNVRTVLQFLACSERELHQRANLSAADVQQVRAALRRRCGPTAVSALQLRENRRLDCVVLPTGLKR